MQANPSTAGQAAWSGLPGPPGQTGQQRIKQQTRGHQQHQQHEYSQLHHGGQQQPHGNFRQRHNGEGHHYQHRQQSAGPVAPSRPNPPPFSDHQLLQSEVYNLSQDSGLAQSPTGYMTAAHLTPTGTLSKVNKFSSSQPIQLTIGSPIKCVAEPADLDSAEGIFQPGKREKRWSISSFFRRNKGQAADSLGGSPERSRRRSSEKRRSIAGLTGMRQNKQKVQPSENFDGKNRDHLVEEQAPPLPPRRAHSTSEVRQRRPTSVPPSTQRSPDIFPHLKADLKYPPGNDDRHLFVSPSEHYVMDVGGGFYYHPKFGYVKAGSYYDHQIQSLATVSAQPIYSDLTSSQSSGVDCDPPNQPVPAGWQRGPRSRQRPYSTSRIQSDRESYHKAHQVHHPELSPSPSEDNSKTGGFNNTQHTRRSLSHGNFKAQPVHVYDELKTCQAARDAAMRSPVPVSNSSPYIHTAHNTSIQLLKDSHDMDLGRTSLTNGGQKAESQCPPAGTSLMGHNGLAEASAAQRPPLPTYNEALNRSKAPPPPPPPRDPDRRLHIVHNKAGRPVSYSFEKIASDPLKSEEEVEDGTIKAVRSHQSQTKSITVEKESSSSDQQNASNRLPLPPRKPLVSHRLSLSEQFLSTEEPNKPLDKNLEPMSVDNLNASNSIRDSEHPKLAPARGSGPVVVHTVVTRNNSTTSTSSSMFSDHFPSSLDSSFSIHSDKAEIAGRESKGQIIIDLVPRSRKPIQLHPCGQRSDPSLLSATEFWAPHQNRLLMGVGSCSSPPDSLLAEGHAEDRSVKTPNRDSAIVSNISTPLIPNCDNQSVSSLDKTCGKVSPNYSITSKDSGCSDSSSEETSSSGLESAVTRLQITTRPAYEKALAKRENASIAHEKIEDQSESNFDSLPGFSTRKKRSKFQEALTEILNICDNIEKDEDLFDRAERRDLPTPHQELIRRAKSVDNNSQSDTTTSHDTSTELAFSDLDNITNWNTSSSFEHVPSCSAQANRQRAPASRRSHIYNKESDDMAFRMKESANKIPTTVANVLGLNCQSYLSYSSVEKDPKLRSSSRSRRSEIILDTSELVEPSELDKTCEVILGETVEPDPDKDDVLYRVIRDLRLGTVLDPQPKFGIPLGPITAGSISDYLHCIPDDGKYRSKFNAMRNPDPVKDDLAFRQLRKDDNTADPNQLGITKDCQSVIQPRLIWPPSASGAAKSPLRRSSPPTSYSGQMTAKQRRAGRSLSEGITEIIRKQSARPDGQLPDLFSPAEVTDLEFYPYTSGRLDAGKMGEKSNSGKQHKLKLRRSRSAGKTVFEILKNINQDKEDSHSSDDNDNIENSSGGSSSAEVNSYSNVCDETPASSKASMDLQKAIQDNLPEVIKDTILAASNAVVTAGDNDNVVVGDDNLMEKSSEEVNVDEFTSEENEVKFLQENIIPDCVADDETDLNGVTNQENSEHDPSHNLVVQTALIEYNHPNDGLADHSLGQILSSSSPLGKDRAGAVQSEAASAQEKPPPARKPSLMDRAVEVLALETREEMEERGGAEDKVDPASVTSGPVDL